MLRDHVCMCAEPVDVIESSRPVPLVAPLKRMQAICKLLGLSNAPDRDIDARRTILRKMN